MSDIKREMKAATERLLRLATNLDLEAPSLPDPPDPLPLPPSLPPQQHQYSHSQYPLPPPLPRPPQPPSHYPPQPYAQPPNQNWGAQNWGQHQHQGWDYQVQVQHQALTVPIFQQSPVNHSPAVASPPVMTRTIEIDHNKGGYNKSKKSRRLELEESSGEAEVTKTKLPWSLLGRGVRVKAEERD